jgi:hypothetical protein
MEASGSHLGGGRWDAFASQVLKADTRKDDDPFDQHGAFEFNSLMLESRQKSLALLQRELGETAMPHCSCSLSARLAPAQCRSPWLRTVVKPSFLTPAAT